MTTKQSWAEILPWLQQLRLTAEDLKSRFPDEADFMPRFADLADDVLASSDNDCIEEASIRITDILIDLGYVPEHERQH
ncbi:hypothetical protein JI752_018725 [Lysobacter sp. MMG2]|uniref:hypothetical protein n=1 Tax=Lysobacter sp. MMG2 TaxID=2801338 RepID=UPI001C22D197|nr:hypothetical protein [Lysobacter sp. MMG2]MBU8978187.1 hypothetical protein [Lysobacter sp. MMG2]